MDKTRIILISAQLSLAGAWLSLAKIPTIVAYFQITLAAKKVKRLMNINDCLAAMSSKRSDAVLPSIHPSHFYLFVLYGYEKPISRY